MPNGDETGYTMKLVANCESIYGMAAINPKMCRNSKMPIRIEVEEGGEGPIPHIHVFFDSYRNNDRLSYIRLDRPECLKGHKSYKPSKSEFDAMIGILNAEWPSRRIQSIYSDEYKIATGYQAAVGIWIEAYGEGYVDWFEYDDGGFPIMPDYSLSMFDGS